MLDYETITYNEFIDYIIDSRGQWNIPKGNYFEGHHIIPRCLGGTGNPRKKDQNIIWLFPAEHLIAHYLLWKENKSNISLTYAFICMTDGLNGCINEIANLSKLYEDLRIAAHEANIFRNKYLASIMSDEEKLRRARIGGNAMKEKLQDPTEHEKYVEKCIKRHANMTLEEKTAIYTKSSNSLKKYYSSDRGKAELQLRKINNVETNKQTAKQWRSEFKTLFGCSPEAYRKYGLLQDVLNLFKEIRYEDSSIQIERIKLFNSKIEEIV